MMSSSFSSGGCLPAQLPPFPPPHPNFVHQVQPQNWVQYNSPHVPPPSFILPPLPPPPSATQFTVDATALLNNTHHYQRPNTGLLPRPTYNQGYTGRGRGSRRQSWKIQKCEACDRVYKSEETYTEHLQSHVKCSQCDFTALPKKVKEHSQVHTLPDFLNFTSPEDIKKWREDRRKNYPTMSNVAKKKKAEEDRRSRGQVIDTPLYRYVNQLIGNYDSHCRGRGRGRRGNYRGRWQRHRSDFRRGSAEESDNSSATHTMVTRPLPTPNGSHNSPTTDTTLIDNDHTHFTPAETTSVNDVSMEENKEETGKQTKRGTKRRHKQSRTKACSDNDKKAKAHCHWTELPLMNRPTLLEKLLASSMRSEHNAILQCVRYIVQNNFFDQPKIDGHHSATNGDGTDTEDTVTKDTITEETVTDQDTSVTEDSVTPADTVTNVEENTRD